MLHLPGGSGFAPHPMQIYIKAAPMVRPRRYPVTLTGKKMGQRDFLHCPEESGVLGPSR